MNARHLSLLFPLALAVGAPRAQQDTQPAAGRKLGDFTVEIEHRRLPAISQGSTGTCWSFATTSFLESELERLHGRPIDLSEMHTVYWGYLEKARRYVSLHGKAQFSQGGLAHDVMYMVERHGVVPQAAYDGLCGGQRHDHSELEMVLTAMLEKLAPSKRPSDRWQDAVRGVLDAYLGRPPVSIEADGKTMTPKEYAERVLKVPTGEYRQLMSYQREGFGRRAELLVPDNWMRHQDYWNVPVETMMAALDRALARGYTVAVDIDVSEPRRNRNIWELPKALEVEGAVTDDLRQQMFDQRTTTDDHLMHVVGVARHEDGRAFYLTKNSWGNGGPYKGHELISRNYLAAKTLSFMVHEDALESSLVEAFKR